MCNLHHKIVDPRILRNKTDRARRASISLEEREEIKTKRRDESYQIKKGQHTLHEPKSGDTTSLIGW